MASPSLAAPGRPVVKGAPSEEALTRWQDLHPPSGACNPEWRPRTSSLRWCVLFSSRFTSLSRDRDSPSSTPHSSDPSAESEDVRNPKKQEGKPKNKRTKAHHRDFFHDLRSFSVRLAVLREAHQDDHEGDSRSDHSYWKKAEVHEAHDHIADLDPLESPRQVRPSLHLKRPEVDHEKEDQEGTVVGDNVIAAARLDRKARKEQRKGHCCISEAEASSAEEQIIRAGVGKVGAKAEGPEGMAGNSWRRFHVGETSRAEVPPL